MKFKDLILGTRTTDKTLEPGTRSGELGCLVATGESVDSSRYTSSSNDLGETFFLDQNEIFFVPKGCNDASEKFEELRHKMTSGKWALVTTAGELSHFDNLLEAEKFVENRGFTNDQYCLEFVV